MPWHRCQWKKKNTLASVSMTRYNVLPLVSVGEKKNTPGLVSVGKNVQVSGFSEKKNAQVSGFLFQQLELGLCPVRLHPGGDKG